MKKAKLGDGIMDLMDVAMSDSSHRQDGSAVSKFNAFFADALRLKRRDVDKALIGKFCSFLLDDDAISWQTSINYLSSVRRQAEEKLGVVLFKEEPEWYNKCRKSLHAKYVQKAVATGKPLREQAPAMTYNDLVQLSVILFLRNTKESLIDRTLRNNPWLAIGRSSDIGNLWFSDLHWRDHYLLIDVTRLKTCQQHSLSIFCAPCEWSIDPFHSLACQLIADPFNASQKGFSQINEGKSDARIAAHINRVLRSTYDFDIGSILTPGLQSHSARRGGAAHASSHADIKLSDLAHRGQWSMDGFATLLEYISPTSSSDQRITKVLGGWRDPTRAGSPPSLDCFAKEIRETSEKLSQFASVLRQEYFAKVQQRGFADCLTATLLMYLPDTLNAVCDHVVHGALASIGSRVSPGGNLSDREYAEQQVSAQTFVESLQRGVIGHREVMAQGHELSAMVRRLVGRQAELRALVLRCQPSALSSEDPPDTAFPIQVAAPVSFALGRAWPSSFNSLVGLKIQDLIVRYVRERLSTVAISASNRLQKEVQYAMGIVKQFADMSTVPIHAPGAMAESELLAFTNSLAAFARETQTRTVAFIDARRVSGVRGGKRNRSITGSVSGVVRAWGELPDIDRTTLSRTTRVEFGMVP